MVDFQGITDLSLSFFEPSFDLAPLSLLAGSREQDKNLKSKGRDGRIECSRCRELNGYDVS